MSISIPGYEIDREIGQGAMASVFLATQTSLARPVALKCMARSLISDQTFCDRFIVEGQIVAKLSHKNVVTIHDIGHSGGQYYMAMEYLSGGTLADKLEQPLPLAQAVEYVVEIAQALEYARSHNIVHRDIKPANILFRSDGTPILSDFGIAKALDGRQQMTAAGTMMGTPNYMSPEQALGKQAGHQSDLYSLGIVFFEMLTGRKPYQATDGFATALKHINDPIPELPSEYSYLQDLLNHWLAKSPDDRIENAATLISLISTVEDDQGATLIVNPSVSDDKTQIYQRPNKKTKPKKGDDVVLDWRSISVAVVVVVAVIYGAVQFFDATEIETGPVTGVPSLDSDNVETTEQVVVDLSNEQLTKISELIEAAEVHFAMKRIAYPDGSNAMDAYRGVLEIQPNNEIALEGMHVIAEYFFARAKALRDQGKTEQARVEVEQGLEAKPQHAGLMALKDIL